MNEIKKARLAAGLSISDVEKLLSYPARTYEKWESEERKPPEYVEKALLKDLAYYYKICKIVISETHITVSVREQENLFTTIVDQSTTDYQLPLVVFKRILEYAQEGYQIIICDT